MSPILLTAIIAGSISGVIVIAFFIAIDVVNQDHNGPGNPFGAHVNMAMKQGATREEIEELLLFMCVYAGFNKAAGAFGTLKQLLGDAKGKGA